MTASPVVGCYVHHVGQGHRQRAVLLARALRERLAARVTGLSSSARPAAWHDPWVELERDDAHPEPRGVDAGGRLHWAPRGDRGLLGRQSRISAWLRAARPALVVVDTSVEVSLLVRLHGVPVVQVLGPGRRDDEPHRLGFDVADALVGFWPARATEGLLRLPPGVAERVHAVGGLSRFSCREDSGPRRPRRPHAVVLQGAGGGGIDDHELHRARVRAPGWELTRLGGAGWREDSAEVEAAIAGADVVVLQPGQNALAEVAALGRPCVVVPAPRPHEEHLYTARVLHAGPWPALSTGADRSGWTELLDPARRLSPGAWQGWSDDESAARLAGVARAVIGGERW